MQAWICGLVRGVIGEVLRKGARYFALQLCLSMEFGAWHGIDQDTSNWESTVMSLDLILSLRQLKRGQV